MVILHWDFLLSSIQPVAPLNPQRAIGASLGRKRRLARAVFFVRGGRDDGLTPWKGSEHAVINYLFYPPFI